jgi:hypothetical protein
MPEELPVWLIVVGLFAHTASGEALMVDVGAFITETGTVVTVDIQLPTFTCNLTL